MAAKQISFFLIGAIFLLTGCAKLAKCKQYVGEYSDRGHPLFIKYSESKFTMVEAEHSLSCTCNDKGQLEINGDKGPVTIALSDSAGKKRFCFSEDSLHEDCVYAK